MSTFIAVAIFLAKDFYLCSILVLFAQDGADIYFGGKVNSGAHVGQDPLHSDQREGNKRLFPRFLGRDFQELIGRVVI